MKADGTLSGGEVWAETVGEGAGAPDGMKIDSQGNLYCCGPGGIHVFSPQAHCLGVIRVPEYTANFAWGDADCCSLYITASTSLYRISTRVPGGCRWRSGVVPGSRAGWSMRRAPGGVIPPGACGSVRDRLRNQTLDQPSIGGAHGTRRLRHVDAADLLLGIGPEEGAGVACPHELPCDPWTGAMPSPCRTMKPSPKV